jgi:mannose-6-phosphate isomerase-like protein (cupin superfamily)
LPAARAGAGPPPAAGGVGRGGPGEGETLTLGPARTTFKLEASDRGGTFSLTETVLPPGFQGPPPHLHERFADSFYVLEGSLTLRLGYRMATAPAGTFALAPPGTPHTFANVDDKPVRFLNLMAPGGFEAYLHEVAERTGEAQPGPELMAEIASQHDFRRAEA